MQLILFLYLKTTSMRINWKRVALYVLRVIELVITGAAGGAMTQLWCGSREGLGGIIWNLSTEHTEDTDFFGELLRKKSLEEIFFKMLLRKKSV